MKNIKTYGKFLNEGGETQSNWDLVNAKAEDMFGEFGLSTCDEDQMNKIIDLKEANKIAKQKFGEFGFATCKEDEMETIINENPKLLRK